MNKIKVGAVFIFLLINIINVLGQESKKYLRLKEKYSYREGYIIDLDSTVVSGLIKSTPSAESNMKSLVFVQKDGQKSRLYPRDILGYGYNVVKFTSDGSFFYEEIYGGALVSLYKRVISYGRGSTPFTPTTNVTISLVPPDQEKFYVIKTGETSLKEVRKRDFMQEFTSYFEDCENVVHQITSGQLDHKDIKELVVNYNFCR